MIDKRFNRWVVLSYEKNSKHKSKMYNCLCDCGTMRIVEGRSLKSGLSKDCGCTRKRELIERNKQGHSIKTKKKISKSKKGTFTGQNSPHWNPNLTDEDRIDRRNIPGYKDWRTSIFERDNYTCQKCNQYGGDLHAHHIESFNNNPDLRIEVSNGITLCEDCHKDFHHQYGYGNNTKEQLNKFLKGRIT